MSLSEAYQRYLPALEDEMRAVVDLAFHGLSGPDAPSLAGYGGMLTYHMGWSDAEGNPVRGGGKRVRPLLCLLTCEAAGGDWERAVPVAAAVELVHNFSLIHDDIQDEGDLRRGQPTVWRVWGVPLAINAGDGLFTLAHLAALRLTERDVPPSTTLTALRVLDETCLRLTQGQHLDISFEQRDQINVESYLHMIEGKSAALLAASASLGALVAGAPDERIERYRLYGLNLGLAFQVIDDILGIWGAKALTGKSEETDLQSKKKTLPVVVGLERSADLRRLYAGPGPLDREGVAQAMALLDDAGARAYAEEVAGRYSEQALAHLEDAQPQGQAAEWLRRLTEELLKRDR
jgi:geranylgeranyl diphosphate synthase type I